MYVRGVVRIGLVSAAVMMVLRTPDRVLCEEVHAGDERQARALYDEVLHRYAAAGAVDFVASVVDTKPRKEGNGNTVGKGELRVRMAKPLSGSFRRTLTTNGKDHTVQMVADGVGVAYLDEEGKAYLDFGDSFAIFCDMIKLDPLYAWAGIKVLDPERLERLDGAGERNDVRGLAIIGVEFRQEIWVDSTGRMVRASVIHDNKRDTAGRRRELSIGRTDYTFSTMELPSKANPGDYARRVPADYKPMDTPNEAEAKLLAVGTRTPDVTLRDLNGVPFQLSSLRGKTVLLDFWFYHCFGCREEMPNLQRLWSEISRDRHDVVFLSVNLGDTKKIIRRWWKTEKFTLRPVLQKKNEVSEAFGVKGYPTHYVLGPDGDILYRGTGYDEKAIRAALATTAGRGGDPG